MNYFEVPMEQLKRNAKRARTIMDREQERGRTDGSVQQTRRMALSVAAAQKATGALERARRSRQDKGFVLDDSPIVIAPQISQPPRLLLLQGGRA